ncbi:MAG: LiaF domain-containing protein [Melioribacteraceae bacterium]
MEQPKLQGRVIIGLLLMILGALAVLHNFSIIDLADYPLSWEYFFIVGGLLFFFLSSNKTVGVIFFTIGLFNLVPELWPMVFVLIGLYIIWGRGGKIKNIAFKSASSYSDDKSGVGNDFVESVNVFGGGNKVIHSDNFKGGSIISIFGGCEIHLSNCKLAPGDNVIEITAIFGGSTIIVPPDWKVVIDVLPLFGGFGDKRIKDPNMILQEGRTLYLKGLVLFGGGEVKTVF